MLLCTQLPDVALHAADLCYYNDKQPIVRLLVTSMSMHMHYDNADLCTARVQRATQHPTQVSNVLACTMRNTFDALHHDHGA